MTAAGDSFRPRAPEAYAPQLCQTRKRVRAGRRTLCRMGSRSWELAYGIVRRKRESGEL